MDSKRPYFVLVAAVIVFAVVTVTAYFKENGLGDVKKLQEAINEVDNDIDSLNAQNRRLARRLDLINGGDEYVEAVARENLGLVKPGEVVYEFVDEERLTTPAHPEPDK